jgi:glycosyltransferase involved in cell wall biosynthesis
VIVGGAPDTVVRAPNVEHRSFVPFRDAGWYAAAADVLCAPQRPTAYAEHQLPAKILQWMAVGGCVLTTDVSDARELLGGDPAAGMVVPAGNPEALRAGLSELIGDDALRQSLRTEAARRAKERYSWTAMSATLDPLIAGLGIHD